jgi:hypothetical protein
MAPNRRRSIWAVLTSLSIVAAACSGDVTQPPGGEATFRVTADLSATGVALVVVQVTGPGITTPLTFNLPIENGVASGTVTIPAGSSRTISMLAFDANGVETHQGSTTVSIASGANPTISLVLSPLTGDAPITATLGSFTVTVTPPTASVAVGLAVTLGAALTDEDGNPVLGTVTWATANPGVASVTPLGVVTGVSAGQTSVVATFQGVAGASTITVTGP